MSQYRYAIHTRAGRLIEELGDIALIDDAEAVEFGRRVVHDMVDDAPERHPLSVLSILQGSRTLTSLPLGRIRWRPN